MSEAESLAALDAAAHAILVTAKPTDEQYTTFLKQFREHHAKYGNHTEPETDQNTPFQ